MSQKDKGEGGAPTPTSSPAPLTRDPDFLKFWVGQSISVFGSQFSTIAIQAIAITTIVATNTQLGLLAFFNTIPFLTLGLLVGVWTDRHRRRRIMIFADFGRAATLLSIPLAFFALGLGGLTMNLLYAVTLVAGILTVFFEIAYQAYIPSLVQKSQLVDANTKLETSRSIAQVAGPSAAGFALGLVTAPLVILGDVLGYLSSSLSLLSLRKPEPMMAAGVPKSTWHDIRQGLSIVFGDKRLRAIAGTTAISNLFSSAFGAITLKYLNVNLTMPFALIGLAGGLGSLGGVLGALTAGRYIKVLGVGRAIVLGAVVGSLPPIALYFASPGDAFAVAVTVGFFTSLGVLWYNIPQVSYRQALVPRDLQGRMNATMRTIVWGTLPLGGLMGGVVGDIVGTRSTMGLMAALGSIAFLSVLLSPVRSVREMPKD
ncbi:MAG: MFS transporter [Thaumarchaeota archaeon]|nr:MFS transporter [Nitrososphaerota archaeon]